MVLELPFGCRWNHRSDVPGTSVRILWNHRSDNTGTTVRIPLEFAIRLFALVFVLAMCLYPVVVQVGHQTSSEGVKVGSWFLVALMVILQLGALWRLWRGAWRKARWVVVALLVLDVLMYWAIVPGAAIYDVTYLGVSGGQFLLHFGCVFLLFLPSSTSWLAIPPIKDNRSTR